MTTDDFHTRPANDFKLGWLFPYLKGLNGYIAGGAFKNIFAGEKVKDLDIFFPNRTAWEKACKKIRKRGWKQAYENTRAVSFIHPDTGVRVELIGTAEEKENWDDDGPTIYGSPEDTIENFDFTITKFALYRVDDEWMVTYHAKFFEHLHLRRLVIDAEMVKPLSTFERTLRYTGYGYRMCRESKVKLITAIQGEPLEDDAQISASFYDGID